MTQPRSPRRSTRTDGDQTQARILDAAGPLFAAGGFAETTSKSIALAAGVDLASINYHFGSRNGLYQAVLADAHRRLIQLDGLAKIADGPASADEKLAAVLDMLLHATTATHHWPAQVLAREILAPTSNARVLLDTEVAPKVLVMQRIVSEITGIPLGEPALLHCLVSIGAPCMMLLLAGNGLPTPIRTLMAGSREEMSAHLFTFAQAGLQAAGARYRASRKTRRPR